MLFCDLKNHFVLFSVNGICLEKLRQVKVELFYEEIAVFSEWPISEIYLGLYFIASYQSLWMKMYFSNTSQLCISGMFHSLVRQLDK